MHRMKKVRYIIIIVFNYILGSVYERLYDNADQ